MMIMSAVDSTFFTLNETATAIWMGADGQTRLSEIVARICSEFEVVQHEAHSDAEQFVKELAEHGVLRISDRPIADASPLPVSAA
ncbi:MAG TPA: PqqD family protein [Terriglobales bacterium]|nr:PqqD family protein [Terriglobales bacterium]